MRLFNFNLFLVFRDVKAGVEGKEVTSDQVDSLLVSLRDKGFINYFGMQRFGTSTIPTYTIGRCSLIISIISSLSLVEPCSILTGKKQWI